ncbi:MAG: hypothetical protein UT70_C0009G0001, partial [Candidatus Nomurabacteria bacterium GW2011_GWE2_40_10]
KVKKERNKFFVWTNDFPIKERPRKIYMIKGIRE